MIRNMTIVMWKMAMFYLPVTIARGTEGGGGGYYSLQVERKKEITEVIKTTKNTKREVRGHFNP